MRREEALSILSAPEVSKNDVLPLIRCIHNQWHEAGRDASRSLDMIVRLVSRREYLSSLLPGCQAAIDDVVRFAGLYPYLDTNAASVSGFIADAMRLERLPDYTLHAGQLEALGYLLRGKSLVLSAPTSFGKSLLVDATIMVRSPKTCVIVLPTLALLDEYRKRMTRRFADYQIITRASQERISEYTIYLGTQERIEEREDIEDVDLFVIDEFYKLDLRRSDERAVSLNSVMARHATAAKQVYLLGPSISSINESEIPGLALPFMRTHFSPVAVDVIDYSSVGPDPATLANVLNEVRDEPTLVYVRSPNSASKLVFQIKDKVDVRRSRRHSMLSEWCGENYHEEWAVTKSIRRGIGVHHGRVPRAVAQYQVALFNERKLPILFCTSSMIEGVNTSTKNVVIFDKHISKNKLDRFTFDNIKGRAGRMFQHFVGRVYLFNVPPEPELFDVEIPLLNGFESASDEVIASVPTESLGNSARRRFEQLRSTSLVPEEILRRWARFGVEGLSSVADGIRGRIDAGDTEFIWSGYGDYEQIAAVFQLVWNDLHFEKHGIFSPEQLSLFATRLRSAATIKEFISRFVSGKKDLSAQQDIDRCFNFLRGAEYTFPEVLRAVEEVVNHVSERKKANYSYFAQSMQNWFKEGNLRELEEYGIPFPMSVRLDLSDQLSVDEKLSTLQAGRMGEAIERDIVRVAFS